eukprot:TRINITY_DN18312_c0_g1_i1.p1 TRINITY_DN18312_c0_g1~~TRINITY_DN18312_c0_g1_i1.p1  ORF type:complete len:460 (+),score=37.51 TRINITY_DN18312_c0_g1_i1:524-1903(+)
MRQVSRRWTPSAAPSMHSPLTPISLVRRGPPRPLNAMRLLMRGRQTRRMRRLRRWRRARSTVTRMLVLLPRPESFRTPCHCGPQEDVEGRQPRLLSAPDDKARSTKKRKQEAEVPRKGDGAVASGKKKEKGEKAVQEDDDEDEESDMIRLRNLNLARQTSWRKAVRALGPTTKGVQLDERRIDGRDGMAFTKAAFCERYGEDDGELEWFNAPTLRETRMKGSSAVGVLGFMATHGRGWRKAWDESLPGPLQGSTDRQGIDTKEFDISSAAMALGGSLRDLRYAQKATQEEGGQKSDVQTTLAPLQAPTNFEQGDGGQSEEQPGADEGKAEAAEGTEGTSAEEPPAKRARKAAPQVHPRIRSFLHRKWPLYADALCDGLAELGYVNAEELRTLPSTQRTLRIFAQNGVHNGLARLAVKLLKGAKEVCCASRGCRAVVLCAKEDDVAAVRCHAGCRRYGGR